MFPLGLSSVIEEEEFDFGNSFDPVSTFRPAEVVEVFNSFRADRSLNLNFAREATSSRDFPRLCITSVCALGGAQPPRIFLSRDFLENASFNQSFLSETLKL